MTSRNAAGPPGRCTRPAGIPAGSGPTETTAARLASGSSSALSSPGNWHPAMSSSPVPIPRPARRVRAHRIESAKSVSPISTWRDWMLIRASGRPLSAAACLAALAARARLLAPWSPEPGVMRSSAALSGRLTRRRLTSRGPDRPTPSTSDPRPPARCSSPGPAGRARSRRSTCAAAQSLTMTTSTPSVDSLSTARLADLAAVAPSGARTPSQRQTTAAKHRSRAGRVDVSHLPVSRRWPAGR